ncbi:MAG: arginine--tRNA ligase [bacterium]
MNVEDLLKETLRSMGVDVSFVEVEVPKDESHGDISSPVAMALAKELRNSPRSIAADIVKKIGSHEMFEKIDVAGPGFINFYLSRNYLYAELNSFLMNPETYTKKNIGSGKRIQIEFVSANPTGPLHLGHGRGAAVGSALANLLRTAGFDIEREFYVNDAGRQVRLLGESVFARYRELCGAAYPFPEDGYKGDYVNDIAKSIYDKEGKRYASSAFSDASAHLIGFSYQLMLDEIRNDLRDFGVEFETFQSERELFSRGDVTKMIDALREKGFIYEQEGAVWFRSSRFGDDKDRVIVKNDGQYTYFASDIAYHYLKIRKGFYELINIWGADHHGYIPRIKSVINAFGYDPAHLKVLLVQMVSLLRGGKPVQMSKRAGEFITLREIMDEIGTDTTRFIFLTRRPDSHLEFDLEVAKQQSAENPVFYVQYAYARINSIFKKAREEGFDPDDASPSYLDRLTEEEEVRLIKKILYYPMVFEGAVHAREPHRITYYLQELAGIFHPYYNRHRVVGEDRELSAARLSLCRAIMIIINEGLSVLGISAPEKM